MKRLPLALLAALLVSCVTGDGGKPSGAGIELVQLVGPAEQQFPYGNIEVKFGLRVENHSALPVRLRQVRLEPVSSGGPYAVASGTYEFNLLVPPASVEQVAFWARARSAGDANAVDARAPVFVRTTAIFDSEKGSSRQVIVSRLQQQ